MHIIMRPSLGVYAELSTLTNWSVFSRHHHTLRSRIWILRKGLRHHSGSLENMGAC